MSRDFAKAKRLVESHSKQKHDPHMGVSKNRGTPKSSILIGLSIINHPFWGTPIFGNTYINIYSKSSFQKIITKSTPEILFGSKKKNRLKKNPFHFSCFVRNCQSYAQGQWPPDSWVMVTDGEPSRSIYPRKHPKTSMSPKTWWLEDDSFPFELDVPGNEVGNRNRLLYKWIIT